MLITIRGSIAEEMLSKEFTSLNQAEKDVMQRTYHNIDQMLIFLMNPLRWIAKKSRWKQMIDLKGKVNPNQKGKEKK